MTDTGAFTWTMAQRLLGGFAGVHFDTYSLIAMKKRQWHWLVDMYTPYEIDLT